MMCGDRGSLFALRIVFPFSTRARIPSAFGIGVADSSIFVTVQMTSIAASGGSRVQRQPTLISPERLIDLGSTGHRSSAVCCGEQ